MSWPNDSSSEEEDDGQVEEEEDEQDEEEDPTDGEEQGEVSPEPSSGIMGLEQGKTKQEVEPWGQRQSWEWGSIMEEEESLAFDDPQSDSNTTVGGHSPVRLTPQELGSP